MRIIQDLILESEILRVENDNDGPQDELEYWKSRAAKLTLLVDQLSSHECRMTLATLRAAQSRLLRVIYSFQILSRFLILFQIWKECEHKIIKFHVEAADNAKFLGAIEKYCHPIYIEVRL